MAASLSMDLRERIVEGDERGDVSCRVVAERFNVAASTVAKLVHQFRTEKSLKPRYDHCGRKRSITGTTEKALAEHLRDNPDVTLQERKDAFGLRCTVKTVWLFLKRLKVFFLKSQRAAEQDREDVALKRADWFECQPDVDPERLVEPVPAGRWETRTLLHAIALDGTRAAMVLAGADGWRLLHRILRIVSGSRAEPWRSRRDGQAR